MTDGRQTEDAPGAIKLDVASRPLKAKGVHMYALAIGKRYHIGQLIDIASTDLSIFRSRTFDGLLKIVANISKRICEGRNLPPTKKEVNFI